MFDALKKLAGGGKDQNEQEQFQALVDRAREERRALREALAAAVATKELIERARAERRDLSSMLMQVSAGSATLKETSRTLEWLESKAKSGTLSLEALTKRIEALEQGTAGPGNADTRTAAAPTAPGEATVLRGQLEDLQAMAERLTREYETLQNELREVRKNSVVTSRSVTGLKRRLDGQAARLKTGLTLVTRSEQALARIDEIAGRTDAKLDAAVRMRDECAREAERTAGDGRSLADDMHAAIERLTAEKRTIDVLDERLGAIGGVVEAAERRMAALTVSEQRLARVVEVSGALDGLAARADELGRRLTGLDALSEQFARVQELAGKAGADYESLQQNHGALDRHVTRVTEALGMVQAVERRLDALRAATGEVDQKIAVQRTSLEALEREQAACEHVRVAVRQSHDEVKNMAGSVEDALALRKELEAMRSLAGQLAREYGALQETSRETQKESGAARAALEKLSTQADELRSWQAGLDALQAQLADIREAAAATTAQHDHLVHARGDLEALGREVRELSQACTEAVRLRDTVLAERAAIDAVDERLSSFHARAPELDAKMEQITGRLAHVDEGLKQAGALSDATARLEAGIAHAGERSRFLDTLEHRLDVLQAVAFEMDQKLVAQRTNLDALTHEREALEEVRSRLRQSHDELTAIARSAERALEIRGDLDRTVEDTQQKLRTLETRQPHVDAAIDKTSRLSEMAASVDARLAGMDEALQKAAHGEQAAARIAHLVGETEARFEAAARLVERFEAGKTGLESFDERLRALQGTLQDAEERMDAYSTQEQQLASLTPRLEEFSQLFDTLMRQADAIAGKQAGLSSLWSDLVRITERMQLIESMEDRLGALDVATAELDRRIATGR